MNFKSKNDDPQKREVLNRRSFAFRLNIFFFSIFLLFSVLIVRLAFLQFVEGREINEALSQTNYKSIPIAPIRGNIYDQKGYPLAYSISAQSLYFRLEPNYTPEELIEMAGRLSAIFRMYGEPESRTMSSTEVLKAMDAGYDLEGNDVHIVNFAYEPRLIKSHLSEKEVAYLLENRDEFRGLEIVEEGIRKYDENNIAVQLVGRLRQFDVSSVHDMAFYQDLSRIQDYLSKEVVGVDGIEMMLQDVLRGENGQKTYPINARGLIIGDKKVEPPQKGNNIFLTIDKDVQVAAEQAILEHLEYLQTPEAKAANRPLGEPTTGYAVAMEVNTGKVMAMASMPDYDVSIWNGGRSISLENYSKNEIFFNNGTIRTSYAAFLDDKERSKHPTSMVPLGSIIKPLTVLVGLNEGLITTDEIYNDTGLFTFGRDGRIPNSDGRPHGLIDAAGAIRDSSNTFMAELIGNRLFFREFNKGDAEVALKVWDEYMEAFGLGVLTGSGLPNEYAGLKEYLNLEQMGSVQSAMAFSAFGQGGRYTTLQLAQYTAMLANRGKRLKPQLVDRITTYDNVTVKEFGPEVLNEVDYPKEYWDEVQQGMEMVAEKGFEDFPYVLASKTGTSESVVAGRQVNNATFIAYAPADNPKLAVAVVVPEGGFGSRGAAPIARGIFDAYDEHIGLTEAKEE